MRLAFKPLMFLMFMALSACEDTEAPITKISVPAPEALSQHSEEFTPEVIKVTDNVYVAVGFGLANSILIEGETGVIIVDTMESNETARAVKAEFDKITSKPVKAIIYTHNHADHIFGSGVFAKGNTPKVYAHDLTNYYIDRVVNVIRPAIYTRAMRQFGNYLPEGSRINNGIGPFLARVDGENAISLARPTHTFSDHKSIEIEGIRMEFVHAPGETPDQLFVWLPDQKVLLPGDNFYKAFPNLYAIRGTSYRDVLQWSKSLDLMRDLRPEFLVPSHTRPLAGSDEIYEILTDYRDAIQYVHDQTVRWINQDLGPDEIVSKVKLPPHLSSSPYLQEFYGMVDWSVRSVFTGYLGWFSGNATDLHPLSPAERASRLSKLAARNVTILDAAQEALEAKDYQWASELSDHLSHLQGMEETARQIKSQALLKLAESQPSANGRNYYLTQALELNGSLTIPELKPENNPLDIIHSLPIENIMAALPVNLKAEEAWIET